MCAGICYLGPENGAIYSSGESVDIQRATDVIIPGDATPIFSEVRILHRISKQTVTMSLHKEVAKFICCGLLEEHFNSKVHFFLTLSLAIRITQIL
jgi:hypothetical protein